MTNLSQKELLETLLMAAGFQEQECLSALNMMEDNGSCLDLLSQQTRHLQEILGGTPHSMKKLKLFHALALQAVKPPLMVREKKETYPKTLPLLLSYLRRTTPIVEADHIRLLLYDEGGGLVGDCLLAEGDIEHMRVYGREIIHTALQAKAHKIVTVQYQKEGKNKELSSYQREVKNIVSHLKKIALLVGIEFTDHLIATPHKISSWRNAF